MPTLAERLIDPLIGREGGFVDHPADRGGPTNWGITERVARRYGYAGDMRTMPRPEAVRIYAERYLKEPGFEAVAYLSEQLAEELFDTGVNMGPATATTFLQRALNVFNRNAKDYPDLKVDGDLGPSTLSALRAFLRKRGSLGETVMLKALNCLQGARYIEIPERSADQEAFAFGWFANRVEL